MLTRVASGYCSIRMHRHSRRLPLSLIGTSLRALDQSRIAAMRLFIHGPLGLISSKAWVNDQKLIDLVYCVEPAMNKPSPARKSLMHCTCQNP